MFTGLIVSYKRDVRKYLSERARINRFRREAVLALRHQVSLLCVYSIHYNTIQYITYVVIYDILYNI